MQGNKLKQFVFLHECGKQHSNFEKEGKHNERNEGASN